LDASLAKNLRDAKNYCAKGKKRIWVVYKVQNAPKVVEQVLWPHLSDYFGTTFAKIRLSCNSLKN
jgi:hypothetical protein